MDTEFLDTAEVADMLRCERAHVYALIHRGMPHVRLGPGEKAPYRFRRSAVMEWLERCGETGGVRSGDDHDGGEIYEPTYM